MRQVIMPRIGRIGSQGATGASKGRPASVASVALLFVLGALVGFVCCASLLVPGTALEMLWRVAPGAREALGRLGLLGAILMGLAGLGCGCAALGLWRGKRWGYTLALALLVLNIVGDVLDVLLGVEPRAIVGVPVAAGVLAFLMSRHVRPYVRAPGA